MFKLEFLEYSNTLKKKFFFLSFFLDKLNHLKKS
jgi:hypothetical protein